MKLTTNKSAPFVCVISYFLFLSGPQQAFGTATGPPGEDGEGLRAEDGGPGPQDPPQVRLQAPQPLSET